MGRVKRKFRLLCNKLFYILQYLHYAYKSIRNKLLFTIASSYEAQSIRLFAHGKQCRYYISLVNIHCIQGLTVENWTMLGILGRDVIWSYNMVIIISWISSTGLNRKRRLLCNRNSILKRYFRRDKVSMMEQTWASLPSGPACCRWSCLKNKENTRSVTCSIWSVFASTRFSAAL